MNGCSCSRVRLVCRSGSLHSTTATRKEYLPGRVLNSRPRKRVEVTREIVVAYRSWMNTSIGHLPSTFHFCLRNTPKRNGLSWYFLTIEVPEPATFTNVSTWLKLRLHMDRCFKLDQIISM